MFGRVEYAEAANGEATAWFMPAEGAPHARTWMGFVAQAKHWGEELVPQVQTNLAVIAATQAPARRSARQSCTAFPG